MRLIDQLSMEEEEFMLEGFPSPDRAREFARRWVRDSVEEFRGRRRTLTSIGCCGPYSEKMPW